MKKLNLIIEIILGMFIWTFVAIVAGFSVFIFCNLDSKYNDQNLLYPLIVSGIFGCFFGIYMGYKEANERSFNSRNR